MSKFRTFLMKTSNLVGIRNWKRLPPVQDIALCKCFVLPSYLRKAAGIPLEHPLWDRAKIDTLLTSMKIRKIKYFFVFAAIAMCMLIIVALYLIGFFCALKGNTCVSSIPNRYYFFLVGALSSLVGLIFWKRRIERFHPKTKFQDFYHPNLTPEQREILTKEILKLKDNRTPVYEVGPYEELRAMDSMFWTADNWFLILTENEKDRAGVWLDGRAPLGDLMIKDYFKDNSLVVKNTVWDKLQLPAFRFLVSDIVRLRRFIQSKKKTPLVRNQPFWVEGFEKLEQVYSDYPRYLAGKMLAPELKSFENNFSPIFAKISKNKSKHEPDANLLHIGHIGAKNFLRGRITSLEKWINSP